MNTPLARLLLAPALALLAAHAFAAERDFAASARTSPRSAPSAPAMRTA